MLQARGKRRSAIIVRCVKAMFSATVIALRAYPTETLVTLCESVQAEEREARC